MVGKLIQVALDMGRGERRTATGKDGIDIIPSQQGTVIATGNTRFIATLGEHRGHTRECPLLGVAHIKIALGILEIIHIRGVVLRATGTTGYQLGKLACKRDVRGFFYMQERYLIEHGSEPLTLLFPVYAQTPDGVAQGFLTHGYLRGESLLAQVHQRTTDSETLGEFVLPVDA